MPHWHTSIRHLCSDFKKQVVLDVASRFAVDIIVGGHCEVSRSERRLLIGCLTQGKVLAYALRLFTDRKMFSGRPSRAESFPTRV